MSQYSNYKGKTNRKSNPDLSERKTETSGIAHSIQSDEKFEAAFRANPNAIIISTKEEGIILDVNDSFINQFGYSKEEVVGRTTLAIQLYVNSSDRESLVSKLKEKGHVANWELRLRKKTGAIRTVLLSAETFLQNHVKNILTNIQDITDRKRIEDELRHSKELYQQLVETANNMIFRYNLDGTILFVNNYALRFFGYSREEMLGKNIMMIVPHTDRSGRVLTNLVHEIIATPEYFETNENENIRKNGERIWVAWTNKAICNESGDTLEILAVGTDITSRKKAEEELKINHSILEAVIQHIGVGFVVSDQAGNIISMNQAAAVIHGFRDVKEGLHHLKQYIIDFNLTYTDGSPVELNEWPLVRALQGDFIKDFKVVLSHKRRKLKKIISYNTVPIYDSSNSIILIALTVTDLTEVESYIETLAEEREVFESIFNNIPVMININDPKTQSFRFNNEHVRTLGWTEKDAGEGKLLEKAYPDPAYRSLVHDYMNSLKPGWKEWKVTAKDGTIVESNWANIQLKSGLLVGIGIDVREIKKAEKKILENEKRLEGIIAQQKKTELELKQKNTQLTNFVYTVSHDLKSPLVTIKAFSSYLIEDIEKQDKEAQEKDLRYIQNASDKMGRLLDELLELSQIGRKEGGRSEILNSQVVQSALDLLAGTISNKKARIVKTGPDVITKGHPQRLIQLYQNLIENSLKFMGSQPNPEIEIGTIVENDDIKFFIKDNGSGIDPRYHHKIFGLFEKLNVNTEGVGIGLAMVKKIVESHNGQIWFDSEGNDQGTVFYFTLDCSQVVKNETP